MKTDIGKLMYSCSVQHDKNVISFSEKKVHRPAGINGSVPLLATLARRAKQITSANVDFDHSFSI